MAKRKALGKGLGALIPEVAPVDEKSGVLEIPMDQITPNPQQPRKQFNEETLAELAASIRSQGVVQPILVRRVGDGYQIVVGERRWRAAQMAGLRSVPAILHDTDDTNALELALVENIHREDLNPLEEARAYKMLVDRLGLTQDRVAERVGRNRSTVANTLRLLRLPDEAKERLLEGKIDMGHARALLSLDNPEAQVQLCRETVKRGLNVRQVERRARQLIAGKRLIAKPPRDLFVIDAERRISDSLEAPVAIKPGRGGGGKIEIFYFSVDDLQRLFDRLTGKK
jgi:ParB family chromosome partitioning protein